MSKSIALISRCPISKNELSEFILSNNGVMTGDENMFGSFACDQGRIWIGLSPEELASNIEDKGKSYDITLRNMLGGSPETCVIVAISRKPASPSLVLDFVEKFSNQWPLIVDDLSGHLFTSEEFLKTRVLT